MLQNLTDLINKLPDWFGDKVEFGIKSKSAAPSAISNSMNATTLASILPYDVFDTDTGLYHNRNSIGFVLELAPLLGANEETVNILSSMLTDILPIHADLQFLLWGSDKIGESLDAFENERSGHGEIYEWLAKKRTQYLKKGAHKSLTSDGNYILRDYRLFLSVGVSQTKSEDVISDLLVLRDDMISTLSSIQMPARNLKVEEFISVITDILHPSFNVYPTRQRWNQFDSLSQQVTDPEYFINVEKDNIKFVKNDDTWEARALTVKMYPQTIAQWKMMDAIGQLFNSSLQIPCPFIISLSIRLIDHEKAVLNTKIKNISKEKSAKSPTAKFMPQIQKEYQDWDFIQKRLGEGDKLVHTYSQVIIFTTEKNAGNAERKARDLYRANGWLLKKTAYLQLQSLLAALPMTMAEGMYSDIKRLGRLRTMTAFNAINVTPLQGEWKGTKTPSLILPGRRGQVAAFELFDNETGNFNFTMSAGSGKGKSAFTNDMIVSALGSGDCVTVIDNGKSYQKTCKMLKGTYIEFDERELICLNPFTNIKEINDSLPMLKPLLASMAHPTLPANDDELNYFEKAIVAAWKEEGNDATISTVANWLSKQDKSETCQQLSHLLYSYTRQGSYGKYFNGKSNIDLSDQFIVLELQALQTRKDLESIVIFPILFQIMERMHSGDRNQRKRCITDEAWNIYGKANANAKSMIETGYRTARKYNASYGTIVQSHNDYYLNAVTLACLENSDFSIILGQNPETIDQLRKNERLPMDAFKERLYKSIRKTDEFSECIIKTPHGMSAHRIIFDPYARVMYSSKAEETAGVEELQAKGHSLEEAIEIIARKFHDF
jgi:conjugal transfer ATP-binding protein TraC